ncbi:MAG: LysR family transcriptional regulator [Brucellaceae bacterium]|jgi:DNA-binding transcriptional LysR family regulator|nr:LysR family transcriptional regulator [Brucellaceae bacterium]
MARLSQRQVELFKAIMINKSMTAAAAVLGTSQPTVSRELREMEKRIGFDLFVRFGKRLTPTNQALLLHEVVRRSFIGMDEISRAASTIRTHNAANFRIATIPAFAETIIPHVARRFLKQHPSVHLSLHSHEELSLHNEMSTMVFDMCITEGKIEYPGLQADHIDTSDLVCILPAAHPLTEKMSITPQDFADVPFIYFSQDDPFRRKIDNMFADADVSCRYAIETTTATSVCAMVAAGIGVSIINPLTAASHARHGMVMRRLSTAISYNLVIWRQPQSHQAKIIDRFTTTLKEVAEEMRQALNVELDKKYC